VSLAVERLARFSGVPAAALREELSALSGGLGSAEAPVLAHAVRTAERAVNTPGEGSPLPQLADLARGDSSRGDRAIAARTLSVLRDAGLYRDPYGVEPVWPHAGMLVLNPFLGCSFGCVYCFRAAEQQHAGPESFLNGAPVRVHDDAEVLDRLEAHPLLLRRATRVGLHSATTEPFLPQVKESTFRLLEGIAARRLADEVMIITKFFLTRRDVERLNAVEGVQVQLLVTFNAAPASMEEMGGRAAVRRRRLALPELLAEHGVRWAHYYRPIVPGWNDGEEQIEEALRFGQHAGVTVIGGLRAIAGQDAYAAARGLPAPPAPPEGDGKAFPPALVDKVVRAHSRLGLTSTLVADQSCGLTLLRSAALGEAVPNIEALRMYDEARCFGRCSPEQLRACAQPPRPAREDVAQALSRLGIDAAFRVDARGVHLVRRGAAPGRAEVEALVAAFAYAVFVEGGDA